MSGFLDDQRAYYKSKLKIAEDTAKTAQDEAQALKAYIENLKVLEALGKLTILKVKEVKRKLEKTNPHAFLSFKKAIEEILDSPACDEENT